MDKEHAYKIWEELFSDKTVAYDYASHQMRKEDFQNENSYYGWDIDEKKKFLNREDNYLPCSINTIKFRNGRPTFKVGNNLFEVRKGRQYGTFSIYDITDRNNPINMDPTEENQDPEYNRNRFHLIAQSKNSMLQDNKFMVKSMNSIQDDIFNSRLQEDRDLYTGNDEDNTVTNESTEEEIVGEINEESDTDEVEFSDENNDELVEEEYSESEETDDATKDDDIDSSYTFNETTEVEDSEETEENITEQVEETIEEPSIDLTDSYIDLVSKDIDYIKTLSARINELNSLIETKDNSFEEIKEKLESINQEKTTLEDRLNSVESHELSYTDTLKNEINRLNEKISYLDSQLILKNSENIELIKSKKALEEQYSSANNGFDLQEEKINELDSKYNDEVKLNSELNSKIILLNEEITKLNDEIETLKNNPLTEENYNDIKLKYEELSKLLSDKQEELNVANAKITEQENIINNVDNNSSLINSLQLERDKLLRQNLFLKLNGDIRYFDELNNYLTEHNLDFNEVEIKHALSKNPKWVVKIVNTLSDINIEATLLEQVDLSSNEEDIQLKNKALNYYHQLIGVDKKEISDFAGRFIRIDDFNNYNSEYGWSFTLFNPDEEESLNNILIANLKSLKDYRYDSNFISNKHTFMVIKEDKYKIVSADYIADPYNFRNSIEVTRNNVEKLSPLVYIYFKVVGIRDIIPDNEEVKQCFSLIDRTVKRCCPLSYIEMKTDFNKTANYAFLTFDGEEKEVYKEVLNYAILLNSYRRQYNLAKEFNAVIVLNKVMVPYSKRHLSFDELARTVNDVELKGIRNEFNMLIVNSSIKPTLHLGPSIINDLDVNQDKLIDSELCSGSYATIYNMKSKFKIYNVAYALDIYK